METKQKVKYPKGETVWVGYYDSNHNLRFIITSKQNREHYFLYRVSDSMELQKLGRSKSPKELEDKYNVYKEMRDN